jgi:predicted lysophospholipase L1 biosynthesis ABC-type transport system permease subunit
MIVAQSLTGRKLRTCIHSRNRRMGEGFSRQARQIFAGIIAFISRKFNAAWREKTRPDGESRL